MRFALFIAAIAATSPASAENWRLFHREWGRSLNEIGYADLASIERSRSTVRLTVRAFGDRRTASANVMMRLEMDCAGRRVRALEARPLDAHDQQTHEIRIDPLGYQPMKSPGMQALGRLVCDGDRSGSEAVPAGMNVNSHAAAILAAMNPAPPEPPLPNAEDAAVLAEMAGEGKIRRFEGVIRRALAEQCGSDLRCRQLESEIERGVAPVVAVEDVKCADSLRGTFGRASCAFFVRHPRTKRRLSCSFELAESVGHHSRYWSHRTITPSPPPPPSPELAVPRMPPPGESSLRCSGSLLPLVSE